MDSAASGGALKLLITLQCQDFVRKPRTAQCMLTLAEDNPALAQLVAGRADVARLLLELTAAVPGSDQGDRLYLRVVGAGTVRK